MKSDEGNGIGIWEDRPCFIYFDPPILVHLRLFRIDRIVAVVQTVEFADVNVRRPGIWERAVVIFHSGCFGDSAKAPSDVDLKSALSDEGARLGTELVLQLIDLKPPHNLLQG